MSAPVFFHSEVADWSSGDLVHLEGEEGRHAAVVRRLRRGEPVELVDGAGGRASGVVTRGDRHVLGVEILFVETVPAPAPRLVVVQALAKGDRSDLAVEMLTEIGADILVPWAADRCVTVWKGDRVERGLARWRSTARSAAKQSRRTWWPQVTDLAGTDDVVRYVREAATVVVLHESATRRLTAVKPSPDGDLVVVVGPEGGITDEELAALDAEPVRLGEEVLRTSTAGVAAASVLLARTPRWS